MPHYNSPPRHEYPHPSSTLYEQPNEMLNEFPPALQGSAGERGGYMKQGDQVEVRIRGNVWIVGLLVSSLHFISSYLGQGYDVEYTDYRSGTAFRAPFLAQDVRRIIR